MKEYLVSIKGPLTTPVGGGIRSLNVAVRQIMDLYVCLRPVRWFKGVPSPVRSPELVDMVIFRENTEDIYAGIEFETGSDQNRKFLELFREAFPASYDKIRFPETSGIGIKPVSREGTERLARAAIHYAIDNARKSVTFVHKGNIMKFTEGAFRNWGYEVAEREFAAETYTWSEWERTVADQGQEAANGGAEGGVGGRTHPLQGRHRRHHPAAGAHPPRRVRRHRHHQPQRRLPLRRAGRPGRRHRDRSRAATSTTTPATRCSRPPHGTAPKYAGRDMVNPGSLVLSAEMMLRYMGWKEAADRIISGMDAAIASKNVTYDFARLMDGRQPGVVFRVRANHGRNDVSGAVANGLLDVARCSRLIYEGFERYNRQFRRLTDRARRRFEQRDWKGQIQDIGERVELYDKWCLKMQLRLRREFATGVDRRDGWRRVRDHYGSRIENVPDAGFMKTFFNSISRRTFGTVGTDAMLEFIQPAPEEGLESLAMRRYPCWDDIEASLRQILADFKFREPYRDADRDARFMTEQVVDYSDRLGIPTEGFLRFEFIDSHFFQGARAYLVGRIIHERRQLPIVVAFENTGSGIRVDAVLLEEAQVSNVFSYTRSYYFTDPTSVIGAVQFLHSILPRKPIDELYTVLGRLRQGKTERFRYFSEHLRRSHDRFVHADGDRGLVMHVFTLRSFNLVFKVIRDHFGYPKNTTREQVISKYKLVSRHDHAGRLIDTQEFLNLKLPANRFEPDLLADLLTGASATVHREGADLVLNRVYVERRVRPLNLYVRERDPGACSGCDCRLRSSNQGSRRNQHFSR